VGRLYDVIEIAAFTVGLHKVGKLLRYLGVPKLSEHFNLAFFGLRNFQNAKWHIKILGSGSDTAVRSNNNTEYCSVRIDKTERCVRGVTIIVVLALPSSCPHGDELLASHPFRV